MNLRDLDLNHPLNILPCFPISTLGDQYKSDVKLLLTLFSTLKMSVKNLKNKVILTIEVSEETVTATIDQLLKATLNYLQQERWDRVYLNQDNGLAKNQMENMRIFTTQKMTWDITKMQF